MSHASLFPFIYVGRSVLSRLLDVLSLNREWRLRELVRVTKENQDILGRITSSRTRYDHNVYAHEWETNKLYMSQISRFPEDQKNSENAGQVFTI